jgi:hypothetical protein
MKLVSAKRTFKVVNATTVLMEPITCEKRTLKVAQNVSVLEKPLVARMLI